MGWVSAAELDRYGLSNALKLATRRAVKKILNAKIAFDEIIIDGTSNFLVDTPLAERVTILKKADLLVKEVSAASIIAKVARDQYMIDLAGRYPQYGFENHVGYGTAAHKAALLEYGICPEHRKSFRPIREILEQNPEIITTYSDPSYNEVYESTYTEILDTQTPTNTTSRGQIGEQVVINYLTSQGHTIVAHNYKNKACEIDIISVLADKIYFTEVKYRQNSTHGSSLDQITTKKRAQMQYAAEIFLSTQNEYQKFQPILAAATVAGKTYDFQEWIELE